MENTRLQGGRVEQVEFEQPWGRDLLQPPAAARECPREGTDTLSLPREGTQAWGHRGDSG